MRLGIDATSVLDEATGVENHVLTVVDALARHTDHELVAFVRRRPPDQWARLGGRVEVTILGTTSQALATQVLLPRAAARAGLDLLYCGGKPAPALYRGALLVGIHDAIPWERPDVMGSRRAVMWFRAFHRAAIRKGGPILTVSESSKRALVSALRIDPARLEVVGNALPPWFEPLIDEPGLSRPACAPDGPYLMAVCRADPRRGLSTLLDAWDLVRADLPDVRLALVGQVGWNVAPLIRRAGSTPGVQLLGQVTDEELAGLYRHASAYVTASLLEGFGLPVLEAMSFGTPVLASAIPPHLEVAGEAATFFPPGDGRALATAVVELLGSSRAQERARRAGRAQAARFSSERLAERFGEVASAAVADWARRATTG